MDLILYQGISFFSNASCNLFKIVYIECMGALGAHFINCLTRRLNDIRINYHQSLNN
jgi:hypothetical protein